MHVEFGARSVHQIEHEFLTRRYLCGTLHDPNGGVGCEEILIPVSRVHMIVTMDGNSV